jgi:prepilin-type N-terminal cleavage/methylation domain-containing protein
MFYTYCKSDKRRAGFTLIELMVAIGVTALLVSLMLTITINVLSGWNRSSGSLTAGNQARTVLDMLSRDLQAAVIKKDSNVWFAASIQQKQTSGCDSGMNGDAVWSSLKPSVALSTDPTVTSSSFVVPALTGSNTVPNLEDYRFGQGGVWLRFFTSATDTNTSTTLSAPRAVSYQIVRVPVVVGSSEFRYLLFRSEVSSSATFDAGYNLFYLNDPSDSTKQLPSPYNTTQTKTKGDFYTGTSFPSHVITGQSAANVISYGYGPGFIRRPDVTDSDRSLVLANNVIDFGVRVWTRDPATNTLVISFPNSGTVLGYAATSPTASIPTPLPNPAPAILPAASYSYASTVGYPEVVEVFVRVLTDEGVTQLALLESTPSVFVGPADILDADKWWYIALQNSKVYTRRIELKATGL